MIKAIDNDQLRLRQLFMQRRQQQCLSGAGNPSNQLIFLIANRCQNRFKILGRFDKFGQMHEASSFLISCIDSSIGQTSHREPSRLRLFPQPPRPDQKQGAPVA